MTYIYVILHPVHLNELHMSIHTKGVNSHFYQKRLPTDKVNKRQFEGHR